MGRDREIPVADPNTQTFHERKSDKETQSPMLRIFREIMQREKAPDKDPENASLLKDRKRKKKKRKFFSHSSSQKHEDDSSGNEDPGPRIIQYDGRNKDQASSVHQATSTDKQESWLYFAAKKRVRPKRSKEKSDGEADPEAESKHTKDQDDTFSCVSCALKKIVSNEYVCVAILCIVFAICVVCAFCALFKAFPSVEVGQDKESEFGHVLDSDLFKKKIEHLSNGDKDLGLKFGRRADRSTWNDNLLPGNLNLLARLRENSAGDVNLESMNAVERNKAITDDLSHVLATCKLNEVTDNVQIRDFYKKLLYTDAQIKRLKRMASRKRKAKRFFDRQKRAIFHRKHRFRTTKNHKSGNSTTEYKTTDTNEYTISVERMRDRKGRYRLRRQGHTNSSQVPSGIIFEKKKLFVKFIKDDDIKFPKCSHASTTYDNHNYEFVHTQKLDEILDKLLDQKIPDVMGETAISRTGSTSQTQTSRVVPQLNNEHKINRVESTTVTPERYIPTQTTERYMPMTHPSTRLNERTTTRKSTVYPNGPLNLIYETTANMYKYYIRPGMNKAKSKIKAEILKMLNAPSTTPSTIQTMIFATPTTSQKTTEKYNQGVKKEPAHRKNQKETTSTKATESYELDFFKEPGFRIYNKESKAGSTFMPGYDLILSVSTLINPSEKRVTKFTANEILRRFPIRKLMQADEVEDEAIGYEDLKEVLSDDMQTHDEMDKSVEKKKRDVNQIVAQSQLLHLVPPTSMPDPEPTQMKPNNLDVHNPNWKGPMPLYQDEINTMIKNAVIHNANKVAVPLNTKDISSELGLAESELNDVQYVEDYLSSKYDKLVKMAQAYSDYGVLMPKKDELRLEKSEMLNVKQDNHVKMLANDTFYDLDETLSKRSKESLDGEYSTSSSALAKDRNPFKAIAKYFKPVRDKDLDSVKKSTDSDIESVSSQSTNKISNEEYMIFNTRGKRAENYKVEKDKLNKDDSNSSLIRKDTEFSNNNRAVPRRSLKSVYLDEVSEEISSTDYYDATTDNSIFMLLNNTFNVNISTDYSNNDKLAFNETNDDLSDIDVTSVKKNKSTIKFLYYNDDNAFEIYVMPLSSDSSVDYIGYDGDQDAYSESLYREGMMKFATNKDNITNNLTSADTSIVGVIFELNVGKRKVFLNTSPILSDDYEIPLIAIESREKDRRERVNLFDLNLNVNNRGNSSYTDEILNPSKESNNQSFQDINLTLPFSKYQKKSDNEENMETNIKQVKPKSNGSFIIRVDAIVNLPSIILNEQNQSIADHETSPQITNSTETSNGFQDIKQFISYENQNGSSIIRVDPMVNLQSIIPKEQNQSMADHETSPKITNSTETSNGFQDLKQFKPYENQNGSSIIRVDPMINLPSIILKEQNQSIADHETSPKITRSTETSNGFLDMTNVSFKHFVNNSRKKRLSDNYRNHTLNSLNVTDSENDKSINNVTNDKLIKPNITNFDPSDFFLMASNFFSSIAGIFFDKAVERDPLLKFVALLTITNNTNATMTNKTSANKTKHESVEYSLYDSEMVDNIGHRSRVLLSIEENSNFTENETERNEDIAKSKVGRSTKVFATETETEHGQDNGTKSTTQTYVMYNSSSKIKEKDKDTSSGKNKEEKISFKAKKSVVKRSAIEDSNLIFWNDIYDEEYGIQTDPLENTIRDKNTLPGNDLVKKSGVWLQDKMKRISETLKKQSRDGIEKISGGHNKMRKSRDSRGLDMFFKKRDDQKSKDSNFDNELFKEKDNPRINNLPQLSAHMKKVCEEAAKAVQMRQGMKADATIADNQKSDEELSVNLMQNLVRLLSDLVDYQVQLKTCNKLPEDLHRFLIWLKAPVLDSKDEKSMMNDESRAKIIESLTQTQANPTGSTPQPRLNTIQVTSASKISTRMSMLPTPSQAWPMEREDNIQPEDRAEYIGALHAVQDLLRQYEMMSAEDKTKMAGVKDYLENQLFYLSRQLYPNEYSYSHLYSQNPNRYRKKRDSSTKSKRHAPFKPGRRSYRQRRHNQSNYKLRGKANKFVESFGKKHTRTTAGSYDNIDLTTEVKKENINKEIEIDGEKGLVKRDAGNKDDAIDNKTGKRSLLNVYYHAVEEAKKSTTIKNVERNLET